LKKRGQVILDEQKGKVEKVVETAKTRVKAVSKTADETSLPEIPIVEELPGEPPAESEA